MKFDEKFDEKTLEEIGIEQIPEEKEDIYVSPEGGDIEMTIVIDGKMIVENIGLAVIDLKTILMAIGYGRIGIEKYRINFVDMVL